MTKSVLVVDDAEDTVSLLKTILEEDYDVITCNNGQQAVELTLQKRPDLVILDVLMEGFDGYAVCRELRGNEDTANIPIILISSLDLDDIEEGGRSVSYDACLGKPFTYEDLVTTVSRLIAD